MKLRCGLSTEEKRALLKEQITAYKEWHDHFAWWPVHVASGDCRWLETVERKYGYVDISCFFNEILVADPVYRAKEKK